MLAADPTDIPEARNLRAAFESGKQGWPSPEEIERQNSGYTATEKEKTYWEKGQNAAQV